MVYESSILFFIGYFFHVWTWWISNSVWWLSFYRNETRRMLRLKASYSRCGEMLLIKNQLSKSGQKDFVKVILSLSNSTSQRKQWLPYPTLRILQTWVHMTFLFPQSSGQWKGNGSRQQKKFNSRQKENYMNLR